MWKFFLKVGAAFAVLLTPRAESGSLALEMQAAKCRVLHTEPAAGTIGLMALIRRMQSTEGQGLMLQLRSMNPHVASAFQVCYLCTYNRGKALFI